MEHQCIIFKIIEIFIKVEIIEIWLTSLIGLNKPKCQKTCLALQQPNKRGVREGKISFLLVNFV